MDDLGYRYLLFVSFTRGERTPPGKGDVERLAEQVAEAAGDRIARRVGKGPLPGRVFLDTSIPRGAHIPTSLQEAVAGSAVGLILGDNLYLHRPHCRWELEALSSRPGADGGPGRSVLPTALIEPSHLQDPLRAMACRHWKPLLLRPHAHALRAREIEAVVDEALERLQQGQLPRCGTFPTAPCPSMSSASSPRPGPRR